MFTASADLYDTIYRTMKDYSAEADRVAEILNTERSGTRTILDVACGTGEHLSALRARHQLQVSGLDVDCRMLEIARQKSGDADLYFGDMRDFDLGRRFEAILCLFSSIGYVKTPEGLLSTLRNFRRHLVSDGVVLIEPWFSPERFRPGRPSMNVIDQDNLKICRMSWTEVDGRTSRIMFEYVVGTEAGIERRSEVHELGLFDIEETLDAMRLAGFTAEFRQFGLSNRGIYIGRCARTPELDESVPAEQA
jgi:SAM-dependent methyltransferase